MATLRRYSMFRQDVSRVASWSVSSGTEDPEYPASKLNGRDPTDPAKLLTTSGIWLADRGVAPSAITCVALFHTNLAAATEVRIKASASADLSSPTLNSVITIPALSNNWPINPFLVFASNSSRYVGICIVGTNPVAVSIGHVALLTTIQSFAWAQSEIRWTDTIPCWDDDTELDVPQNMDLLTQLRACVFETINSQTEQAALDDWWFDARAKILPFVFIPDVTVNECYYMTWQEKSKEVVGDKGIRLLQVKLKEFGRGMLPTPWLV